MHEIPQIVQNQILKNRKHFHDLNAKTRERSNGVSGFSTKPLELELELQFWKLDDDDQLIDFLFEDLLPALYGELDLSQLPCGYAPLIQVLEFERHCDFEGWGAVGNKSQHEMEDIIRSYRIVGLQDESEALKAVHDAYKLLDIPDDDDINEADYDTLGNVYANVPNSTSDPDERIIELLKYVRENSDHFR